MRAPASRRKPPAQPPARVEPRAWLARERLLGLDQGLPVLVIEAPAGYGKTVFAQQWLDAQRARSTTAWVSLDPASRDPVVFLDQLVQALGGRVNPARATAFDDAAGRAERFEQLCRKLRELEGGASVVIDDCHALAGSASARYLERLLQMASPRLRLCLTLQPAALAAGLGQRAAQGLASWISPASLAFTRDEIAALATLRGDTLTPAQLDWLHDATGGWPSFVQLALCAPRGGPDGGLGCGLAAASSGAVREYLCERFLNTLNDPERELLWLLACLDSAPQALLTDLLPASFRVEAALQRLRTLGLMQNRDPRDDGVVRLPALMREAVIAHVAPSQPQDRTAILRAAAEWYWHKGRGVDAVRTALDAGAALQEPARQWLGRLGLDLVFRFGQHQTLLDLVDGWERLAQAHDPAIDSPAAWALVFQRRFAEALERIDRIAVTDEHRMTALLQRAVLVGLRDEYAECGRLAHEWIQRHHGQHSFGMAVAAAVSAFSLKCLGDPDGAQAALREAFHSFTLAQFPYGIGWVYMIGALALVHTGNYRAALAQVESGLQRCPGDQGFGSLRALLRAIEAFVRYERGELAEVQELLGDVLGLLAEQGVVDVIALGFTAAARARGTRGELGAALDLLSEAEQIGQRRGFPRLVATMHAERALLLLRAGSTLRARALIDAIPARGELSASVQLLRARLAVAEGDPATAIDLLSVVLAEARLGHRLALHCEALLLKAHAEELRGAEAQALASLGEALDLAGSEGYARMLLDDRRLLAPLARRWLAAEGGSETARRLARQLAGEAEAEGGRGARTEIALTARQREILALLNQGLSNAQLAKRCFLSESTVKWYLHNLYETFGVANRTALLRAVRERGLAL